MSEKEERYPADMEPLESDDQFFVDLCELIDEHAEDADDRELYLYAIGDFKKAWMDTLDVTGRLWRPLDLEDSD